MGKIGSKISFPALRGSTLVNFITEIFTTSSKGTSKNDEKYFLELNRGLPFRGQS